jgi:N-hydroxyarylamine O-acetyltransferase
MHRDFPLADYLARIGVGAGSLDPDLPTLRRLHAAHVGAIPFENLDVQCGRGVRIDLASLVDKLIACRRGGYCFEQNTLFMHALEAIGFAVTPCEARVRAAGSATILPRTHMVLLVGAGQSQYLADVGFGAEGLLEPLPAAGEAVFQIDRTMRVGEEGPLRVLQWSQGAGWQDCYAFAPERRHPVDFELGNWWVSTHPSSVFRQRITLQRTLPQARHVLRQLTYSIYSRRGVDVREITRSEFPSLARDVFGLDVTGIDLPALDAASAEVRAAAGRAPVSAPSTPGSPPTTPAAS